MYLFLVPLLLGFVLIGASAFTAEFSRRWGERGGQVVTFVLRNILGIPLWLIGLALAWLAPAPLLLTPGTLTRALGLSLIVLGLALMAWGHLVLGWTAHAPSVRDALVRHGPYAHVRHPIYTGLAVAFVGLALLWPTSTFVLACVLTIGWFIIQARLEEMDLRQRLPGYREYAEQVPAFVPRVWRWHRAAPWK